MADIFQNNINKYIKDGARQAKFEVWMQPPQGITLNLSITSDPTSESKLSGGEAQKALTYFCYAGSFPGLTSEVIEFKYLGRTIPIPNTMVPNQTWSATFYNDEKHAIRKMFKDWMESNQTHNYNKTSGSIPDEMPVITIYQYDYELKQKTTGCALYGVFPVTMSDIEITYEGLNQVETFQVEFRFIFFDYFNIEAGLSADGIKDLIKNTVNEVQKSAFEAVKNFGSSAYSAFTNNLGISIDPIGKLEGWLEEGVNFLDSDL